MSLQKITGPIAFVVLLVVLVFVNFLQMVSVLIFPFSQRAFRAFNRACAGFWWGSCVICVRYINRAKLVLTGDPIPYRENAIVIANHANMSDILLLLMLAYESGRIADLKWFVKDVLKYVPGIGWGMLFLDCIFVKRNWESDKEKIKKVFAKFEKNDIPFWLISFVEGTRFTKEKSAQSQKYAREKQLPILDNVLLPRTKGFTATIKGLGANAAAVYDITIGHIGEVPSLWDVITRKNNSFHLHVRRYPTSELPEDEKELSNWLITRFCEKDLRLQEFRSRGSF